MATFSTTTCGELFINGQSMGFVERAEVSVKRDFKKLFGGMGYPEDVASGDERVTFNLHMPHIAMPTFNLHMPHIAMPASIPPPLPDDGRDLRRRRIVLD